MNVKKSLSMLHIVRYMLEPNGEIILFLTKNEKKIPFKN